MKKLAMLIAALTMSGAAVVESTGVAHATGVHCQTSTSGSYQAMSSCSKTDNLMNFRHRVTMICQNGTTGYQFPSGGSWKTTLVNTANWSVGYCPQGSFRVAAWAQWQQV